MQGVQEGLGMGVLGQGRLAEGHPKNPMAWVLEKQGELAASPAGFVGPHDLRFPIS